MQLRNGRWPPCQNLVLLLLTLVGAAAMLFLPLMWFAPNRLVSGEPVPLEALLHGRAPWLWVLMIYLLMLAWAPARASVQALIALSAGVIFAILLLFTAHAADQLAGDGASIARSSPGSGLWLLLALNLLLASDAIRRLTPRALLRWLLNAAMWLVPLWLLFSGRFDNLSLLKEYANRQDVFDQALYQHLVLLAGTLLPGLAIGLPLGWLCHRQPHYQGPVFGVLNIIQTVPSVALFGLLIAPLAGLAKAFPWLGDIGIGGIGLAPALIALVLYALLPLVRGVVAGLDQVPALVLESAKGMGMSRWQRVLHVQIPLALPVLLRNLRVVAVQTIGMAVVAALIGAGGLGSLVFQGLLSSALDLVLLGVIPTIALAVFVDALFKLLTAALEVNRHDRV